MKTPCGAMPRIILTVLAALLMFMGPGQAAGDNPTLTTARYLLKRASTVQRDGSHNLYLRALRHLHDPQLKPVFERLMASPEHDLVIHGFLGSAECDKDGRLNLAALAEIKTDQMQAEMISAALDSDLVDVQAAKQAVTWPNLDITVKLLVAAKLVQEKQFNDLDLLRSALKDPHIGRQGMAGLMLMQLGQPEGLEALKALDQSSDPRLGEIKSMLSNMAWKSEYDKTGPWALEEAKRLAGRTRAMMEFLVVALRYAGPDARAFWLDQYKSSTDAVHQLRLALVALKVSPWMTPEFFDPLVGDQDTLIKCIGLTGRAVAQNNDVEKACAQLVAFQHPLATEWAITYAKKFAKPSEAVTICKAVIEAYNSNRPNQAQRFDDAVAATQVMHEKSPADARTVLAPILADAKTGTAIRQAILLGLIRCGGGKASAVCADLPPFEHPSAAALMLVLKANNQARLTDREVVQLGVVVRGGGDIPETLRVQAAWDWLKMTGHAPSVVDELTSR